MLSASDHQTHNDFKSTLTYFVFFVGLPHGFDPTCEKPSVIIFLKQKNVHLSFEDRNAQTRVMVMKTGDVEALWSPSSQLKPHRRHRRQLGTKQLSNVISTGVPLRDQTERWMSRQTYREIN